MLIEMGADIQTQDVREEAGEPVADLRVRAAPLRGICIGRDRIPQTIDEFPILCVAAALADGDTVVSGAEELRLKESDRIATMAAELGKMGVVVIEAPDGMTIRGRGSAPGQSKGRRLNGARCVSYGDHRVAMSLAVAGLVADSPTQIAEAECIETSFPAFEENLLNLLKKS